MRNRRYSNEESIEIHVLDLSSTSTEPNSTFGCVGPAAAGMPRMVVVTIQAEAQLAALSAERLWKALREIAASSPLRRLNAHMLRDISLTKADIETRFPEFPSQRADQRFF